MFNDSIYLDVDPTIIERNMMIAKEAGVEEELKNIINTSNMKSKLVKPSPGFCIKTFLIGLDKKLFINICHTDAVPAPEDISDEELLRILELEVPSKYRVPMSIGEARDETDKSGNSATAYDIAIHPKFLAKVEKNELFRSFFLTVVFEALQDKYQVEIDVKKYLILKNRKSVGAIQSHRIQIRDSENQAVQKRKPLIEEIETKINVANSDETQNKNASEIPSNKTNIEYRLYREPASGCMKYLIGEFKIADNVYCRDLRLDIGEDRIILESKQNHTLDLFVQCKIKQNEIQAYLDRNTGILRVKMAACETC